MKHLSTLRLLTLLLLGSALWSCRPERNEIVGVDIVDPYEVSFEIKDAGLTSTSYTFEVTPSSAEAPYVCLYVNKSVIDRIPKHELPTFLVSELKKNAEANNKTYASYLNEIIVKGKQQKTISGLQPGNMYELVVFGIKGEQLSREAGFRFFETLKADPIEMTFIVTNSEITATRVKLEVKPSKDNVKWYFCSFTKTQYDRLKEQGLSDTEIITAYLEQEAREYLRGQATPSEEVIQAFIDQKFFVGDRTLTISGTKADTNYVYLLSGVAITEKKDIIFISDVQLGTFDTPAVAKRATTFELRVDQITQTTAQLHVVPSDPTERYVWRYGPYNDLTRKMTPEEQARYIVDTNGWINWESRPHQTLNAKGKLTPGAGKHFLIAFGYAGGICTDVARIEFDPLPQGDVNLIDFEVTEERRTTDEVRLKVKPNDPSIYYLPMLYPDGESKESKKGGVIADLRRRQAMDNRSYNPGSTLIDMISQSCSLGEQTHTWSTLKAGTPHTLMILTLDSTGISGDKFYHTTYLTVPGFSTETVGNARIMGVFDGNEEQGAVFGQADAVKDKAIMVIRYDASAGVSEAYAASSEDSDQLDETDPTAMPDSEIMRSTSINWTKMKVTAPYLFLLLEWDKPQVTFSYGLSDQMERGPVARALLPGASKDNIRPIDELRTMVNEANSALRSTHMRHTISKLGGFVEQMPRVALGGLPEAFASETEPAKRPAPLAPKQSNELAPEVFLQLVNPVK